MKFNKIFVLAALIMTFGSNAQENVDKKILNWYNGKKYGMSTDLAYSKLLSEKKSTYRKESDVEHPLQWW